MLAYSYEEENLYKTIRGEDGAIRFFRERAIKWWRGRGDTPRLNFPTRNMKCSQIMCVNFLLPLAEIDGALAAVVRAIDPDVKDIIDINHKGNASPVEFEWVGLPRSLEGKTMRGAGATSVDAFMVSDIGSRRRAYLVEWKYAEQYLATRPKCLDESSHRTKKQLDGYRDLYYAVSSSFSGSVPMDELLYEPFDQIMRLRLLADRMVADRELGVSDAKVVVVAPNDNTDYQVVSQGKKCTSPPLIKRFPDKEYVGDMFRAALKRPDDSFAMVCPYILLAAVEGECPDTASAWVAYMKERYGL